MFWVLSGSGSVLGIITSKLSTAQRGSLAVCKCLNITNDCPSLSRLRRGKVMILDNKRQVVSAVAGSHTRSGQWSNHRKPRPDHAAITPATTGRSYRGTGDWEYTRWQLEWLLYIMTESPLEWILPQYQNHSLDWQWHQQSQVIQVHTTYPPSTPVEGRGTCVWWPLLSWIWSQYRGQNMTDAA